MANLDKMKSLMFIDELLKGKKIPVSVNTRIRICKIKIGRDDKINDADMLAICEEASRQKIPSMPPCFNSLYQADAD